MVFIAFSIVTRTLLVSILLATLCVSVPAGISPFDVEVGRVPKNEDQLKSNGICTCTKPADTPLNLKVDTGNGKKTAKKEKGGKECAHKCPLSEFETEALMLEVLTEEVLDDPTLKETLGIENSRIDFEESYLRAGRLDLV